MNPQKGLFLNTEDGRILEIPYFSCGYAVRQRRKVGREESQP